eukprot:scaffold774_cov248-Pinguiococcus_pyrenoidosus.AAC.13
MNSSLGLRLAVLGALVWLAAPKKAAVELPYIRCGTCRWMVSVVYALTAQDRAQGKAVDELTIDEHASKLCKDRALPGRWMRHLDIVEEEGPLKYSSAEEKNQPRPRYLKLVEQWSGRAECKEECKVLRLSCQEVMDEDYLDMEEVVLAMYRNETATKDIQDQLCAKACKGAPVPLPQDFTREDYEFVLMDIDEAMMEDRVDKAEKPPEYDPANPKDYETVRQQILQEL